MPRSRVLLPFTFGALSMLVVVVAAAWAISGLLSRADPALLTDNRASGAAAAPVGRAASAEPVNARPAARTESGAEAPVNGRDRPADRPAGAASPPADRRWKLLIPVKGVPAESLVDTYEDARGEGRRHDAIDIMAARGTPVLAAADGVVMKLFQSELGGTTLYQLAADRRTIYYYAHLDGYAPAMLEGRALRRGEVLGYVGDTGVAGSGNYHLHFEVSTTADTLRYWGGIPQNPYPLLR